jgi:hypothetical protein
MTDIIIYTTGDKLLHKQGKLPDDDDYSEDGEYYWHLSRCPKDLQNINRIYFAVNGYIRGYFKVHDFEVDDGCDILFYSDSWKDITSIPCTHFQGFKYATKWRD